MTGPGSVQPPVTLRLSLLLVLISCAITACAPSSRQPLLRNGCVTANCDTPSATIATSSPPATAAGATSSTQTSLVCAAVTCAATGVEVFVEPDAGESPVVHAIQGASSSIEVEVYILTDRAVIHALEDAAGRGVDVRVLLETNPFGGGGVAAQQTLQELQAAGVKAESADPAFHYTHEKALIVDRATAYILTANLSRSGLGGSTSSANRDYGVVDSNAADVAAVEAIFRADWTRTTATVTDPRLIISPVNARASLRALIAAARKSLIIEDEEMYDQQSESDLVAAARRGVNVELLLPPPAGSGSYAADVARLMQGGVHVRYISMPYMHAKLILDDGTLAFTGSENFSSTSLDENRELGIILADPAALTTLSATFARDWAIASDA